MSKQNLLKILLITILAVLFLADFSLYLPYLTSDDFHRERGIDALFALDYDEAHKFADRAIELGEKNGLNYRLKGKTFFKEAKFEKAKKYSYKALELTPKGAPGIWLDLAKIFREQDKPKTVLDLAKISLNVYSFDMIKKRNRSKGGYITGFGKELAPFYKIASKAALELDKKDTALYYQKVSEKLADFFSQNQIVNFDE